MLKSNEIVWKGPNIPCLQLCTGDTTSDVIYKIASEVCCIIDDLDLTKLDYQCIIDKAQTYKKIDLFLLFSMLLKNDCAIKDLITAKLDELDTTELLVNSLDLKCFLQDYLDEKCTIIRFYNQPGLEVNPNNEYGTIFQKDLLKTKGVYYVSDIDQSVWEYDGLQYVKNLTADLNTNCYCDLESLDLDVPKVLQVIINNICQTKSSGIIKACDSQYKPVHFNTVDPNNISTVFVGGLDKQQSYYYISSVTHKIWRWVPDELSYLPSLLTSSNINIIDLDSCLSTHEQTFQNWVDLYQVYQEPEIVSCLSADPTILSLHVTSITDKAICDLQSNLGSAKDIYYSHIGPCSKVIYFSGIVNSSMNFYNVTQTEPNWLAHLTDLNYFYINKDYDYPFYWNGSQYVPFTNPITYTDAKQDDALCNLLGRLEILENTCCTPTCDNTTIVYSSSYNEGVYTLTFDEASGTSISDDFIDCGSIITITDFNNNSISSAITLSQDLIYTVDTTGLDNSKELHVNIKSCLSNGTLNCSNCNSFTLPAISPCGLCKICAISNSEDSLDSITIKYTALSSGSTVLSSTLIGGQCLTFSLPEDEPTIISVERTASTISLINDDEHPCTSVIIPNISTKKCWYFPIPARDVSTTLDKDTAIGLNPYKFNEDYKTKTDSNYDNVVYNGFIYSKLTYNNNSFNITGETTSFTSNVDGDKDGHFEEDSSNDLTTFPKIPTGYTGTVCGNIRYYYTDSGANGAVNTGSNNEYPSSGLGWARDNNGSHGIVLEIASLDQPEIELIDVISGNKIYIKGESLSDDCNCPQ